MSDCLPFNQHVCNSILNPLAKAATQDFWRNDAGQGNSLSNDAGQGTFPRPLFPRAPEAHRKTRRLPLLAARARAGVSRTHPSDLAHRSISTDATDARRLSRWSPSTPAPRSSLSAPRDPTPRGRGSTPRTAASPTPRSGEGCDARRESNAFLSFPTSPSPFASVEFGGDRFAPMFDDHPTPSRDPRAP